MTSPRAAWATSLLPKQCWFCGEMRFTEQGRELPQGHTAGGVLRNGAQFPGRYALCSQLLLPALILQELQSYSSI